MKVKVAIILSILFAIVYFSALTMGIFVGLELEPRYTTCTVGEEVKYTLTIQNQEPRCFLLNISGVDSSWIKNFPSRVCVNQGLKTIQFSIIPKKEGNYSLFIRVASYDSENFVRAYLNVRANYPPTSIAVTPDKFDPQCVGTTISWTASAYDPDGDTLYYRFWLLRPGENQESIVRDWSVDNKWVWNTTGLKAGTYTIFVDVKDGFHAGVDKFIGYEYTLCCCDCCCKCCDCKDSKCNLCKDCKCVYCCCECNECCNCGSCCCGS